jgi:hypothetical protein
MRVRCIMTGEEEKGVVEMWTDDEYDIRLTKG